MPSGCFALLVDGSTRRDFLQATIADCLARVPATSPNAQLRAQPVLIDATRGEQAAVDQLLHMVAPSR